MASDEYGSIPSSGKLKLKGVKDSKVSKKKKHKAKRQNNGGENAGQVDDEDKSVILKKLEDGEKMSSDQKDQSVDREALEERNSPGEDAGAVGIKTEAERRYEEQRRKRLDERLKREGVKTHKQRVEELNRYLSGLSEHHDMPRIGPG